LRISDARFWEFVGARPHGHATITASATISATMARKTSAPRSDVSHTTVHCTWIPDRTTPKAFKVSITSR
jgi:hypothetical protein